MALRPEFGRPEPLEVPTWARGNFRLVRRTPFLNPLDLEASSRMMGFGTRAVLGMRTSAADQRRISSGALAASRGRTMMYSPVGYGRSYQ